MATPIKLPNQLRPAIPALLSSKHPQSGVFTSLSFRTSPTVALDVKKAVVPNTSESGPKPCHGCLGRSTIADAVDKVIPAVVHLRVCDSKNIDRSIGSGIIIDEDGMILTCAHNVMNLLDSEGRRINGTKVYATLSSNNEVECMVVKTNSDLDIAFMKIINPESPLQKAKLGCSNKLRPGDWVVSIGSSYTLANSVAVGVVSYMNRTSNALRQKVKRVYLQTDCAFNEGNSGGPLLNLDGEVVGVNDLKLSKAEGMSFALTIDSISTIIDEFKKSRMASKPYLGFTMIDVDEEVLPEEMKATFPNVVEAVLVYSVKEGSHADACDVRPGDFIIQCDGKRVSKADEVNSILENKKGPVKMHVKRAKKRPLVPLTLNPEVKLGVHHISRL